MTAHVFGTLAIRVPSADAWTGRWENPTTVDTDNDHGARTVTIAVPCGPGIDVHILARIDHDRGADDLIAFHKVIGEAIEAAGYADQLPHPRLDVDGYHSEMQRLQQQRAQRGLPHRFGGA